MTGGPMTNVRRGSSRPLRRRTKELRSIDRNIVPIFSFGKLSEKTWTSRSATVLIDKCRPRILADFVLGDFGDSWT